MAALDGHSIENAGEVMELTTIETVEPGEARGIDRLPPPPPSLREKCGTTDWEKLGVTGDPRIAEDLMSRQIFTIGPNDPIAPLVEQMRAFRFRHLPVVEGRKLVGLITHADLLAVSSSWLAKRAQESNHVVGQLPARAVMQHEPLTVRPTTRLADVAALMWSSRYGCVPVTHDDGTLVGIITEGDFVRLGYHFLEERPEEPLSIRDTLPA